MKVSVSNHETNQQKSQSQYQVWRQEIKSISLSLKVETSMCKVSVSVSTCKLWSRSPLTGILLHIIFRLYEFVHGAIAGGQNICSINVTKFLKMTLCLGLGQLFKRQTSWSEPNQTKFIFFDSPNIPTDGAEKDKVNMMTVSVY